MIIANINASTALLSRTVPPSKGLQVDLRPQQQGYVSIEVGTEDNERLISSIANRGSLGGTMTQSVSANKPFASTFKQGRAVYFDASKATELVSSLTASAWTWLSDGTDWEIGFVTRMSRPGSAAIRTVLFTTADGAATTNIGLRLDWDITNSRLNLIWMNDSGTEFVKNGTTPVGSFEIETNYFVVLRYDSSDDHVYVRINGTEHDLGVINTPSINTPEHPLYIGSGQAFRHIDGWFGPFVAYNRVLSTTERTQLEAYLNLFSLEAGSPLDVFKSTEIRWFKHGDWTLNTGEITQWNDKSSNGDHATPHAANIEINSVDIYFNGFDTVRFGGTTTLRSDSIASIAAGDDQPWTQIYLGRYRDPSALERLGCFGTTAGVARGTINTELATPPTRWQIQREDDSATISTASTTGVTPDSNTHIFACVFDGQSVDFFVDGVFGVEGGALDRGVSSFDTFTFTGLIDGGSFVNNADFDSPEWIIIDRNVNRGDLEAIFDLFRREYFVTETPVDIFTQDGYTSLVWYDSSVDITITSDPDIDVWGDQGDDEHDAFPFSEASSPHRIVQGSGFVIDFDGTAQEFETNDGSGWPLHTSHSAFWLVNRQNPGGGIQYLLHSSLILAIVGGTGSNTLAWFDGTWKPIADSVAGWQILEWHLDADAGSGDIIRTTPSGSSVLLNTTYTPQAISGPRIGSNAGSNRFAEMQLASGVLISRATGHAVGVTDAVERAAVRSHLFAKAEGLGITL